MNNKGRIGCGTVILLVCVVLGGYLMYGTKKIKKHLPATVTSAYPSNTDICVIARQAVERLLKSPSTAEFPSCREITITELGDDKYRVTGYVDAQNSFGVEIRSQYMVELKDQGDGNNWTTLDIKIE